MKHVLLNCMKSLQDKLENDSTFGVIFEMIMILLAGLAIVTVITMAETLVFKLIAVGICIGNVIVSIIEIVDDIKRSNI